MVCWTIHVIGRSYRIRNDPLTQNKRKSGEEQKLAIARADLGETEFAAAWAVGRTMTTEQDIAQALKHTAREV